MNFRDLRIIVNQIKRSLKCPSCNAKYTDEDIEVVGHIMGGEESIFHAFCPECEVDALVHVNLQIEPFPAKLGTAPRMGNISTNEILDLHNFLSSFDGNFSNVFKKEINP